MIRKCLKIILVKWILIKTPIDVTEYSETRIGTQKQANLSKETLVQGPLGASGKQCIWSHKRVWERSGPASEREIRAKDAKEAVIVRDCEWVDAIAECNLSPKPTWGCWPFSLPLALPLSLSLCLSRTHLPSFPLLLWHSVLLLLLPSSFCVPFRLYFSVTSPRSLCLPFFLLLPLPLSISHLPPSPLPNPPSLSPSRLQRSKTIPSVLSIKITGNVLQRTGEIGSRICSRRNETKQGDRKDT